MFDASFNDLKAFEPLAPPPNLASDHTMKQRPNVRRIETIEGYGVYLTQRQLDEALHQSCSSPTRLVNLMSCFFPPTLMAKSSCFGTRRFPKLNEDIVGACFRFVQVQKRYPEVGRSTLVNAVNDKCANHRRAGTKWLYT
ncbi:uncharacterized protein LOC135345992 [Halichondria panicea]|uniref:uncharacterized protein LOC135345992 n=1 Tax=Halichondria panicea TaxID=6063 RepID=UPI00312B897F